MVTRLTSPRGNSKKLISKREKARSTIQKKKVMELKFRRILYWIVVTAIIAIMVYVPAIKWIMFIFFIFLMMEKIIIRTLIKTRLLEIYPNDEEDLEDYFDWLYSYRYQGKIKKICMWGLKTMLILFVVLILLCD